MALLAGALAAPLAAAPLGLGEVAEESAPADPEPVIDTDDTSPPDAAIEERLRAIFGEIEALAAIDIEVSSGVVTLSGQVAANADIDRAERIAARVAGVVTVQNDLERSLEVADNLTPLSEQMTDRLDLIGGSLPLLAIAFAIVAAFWLLGGLLARAGWLWRAITPNAFLAELVATGIKVAAVIVGMVVALDLLEATALLGAFLGSAGVIGLAIGFAIRDTVDNYVSSIMLSIRQPFRANDHVVIGEYEGHVIRLTSRATILMTLDGNHLRLPNSTVFKSEILNYSTNPQRRLEFELGIDAEDDPADAICTGIARLKELPFVLEDPAATGQIEQVGDSNIVIRFMAWIDQTETDFHKARTSAIREVKTVLEDEGFGLPEPIYRLRFDSATPLEIARAKAAVEGKQKGTPKPPRKRSAPSQDELDVSADNEIARKVEKERAEGAETDILDPDRPLE
ncbi:MAG: mechanosensitive ion channel domain-containing protein [Erythrobacter sp.]